MINKKNSFLIIISIIVIGVGLFFTISSESKTNQLKPLTIEEIKDLTVNTIEESEVNMVKLTTVENDFLNSKFPLATCVRTIQKIACPIISKTPIMGKVLGYLQVKIGFSCPI